MTWCPEPTLIRANFDGIGVREPYEETGVDFLDGILRAVCLLLIWTAAASAEDAEPAGATTPAEAVLFDFEDVPEAECWSMMKIPEVKKDPPEVKVERSTDHATSGKHSLKLTFDGGEWPAVATTKLKLPEDVFSFQSIRFDVTVDRPCVVAVRILQEESKPGVGWNAGVSRWNTTAALAPGRNEVVRKLRGRADWEALSPKFGKLTTFVIMLYNPRQGESIYVDHIRLSADPAPAPPKTAFKVLGTDLVVSGVAELGKKLNTAWKTPEQKTVEEIEADFRKAFDALRKTHPKAVLAVFREGQKGYDPSDPEKVYEGWADTHLEAHSPDGPNPGRTAVFGTYGAIETFMRHRSQLMRIDVSSIPTGTCILAAGLVIDGMEQKTDLTQPNMWAAEACNRPWVETELNGYQYAKDKFWKYPGGMHWEGDDPDFLPVYLAHGPSQGHVSHWDFTEAVRFWTDGKHPNHGFMLHGTNKPYMRTFTREYKDVARRPALMVVYEPKQ